MKIISWNVNGLRAVYKKGALDWLWKETPDIICLQETKASPEQLPPDLQAPAGYHASFATSTKKKGYSGVATFSKLKPERTELGHGILNDQEGRLLETHFKNFTLCNVYFPNGGGGPERLAYKLAFYDAFLEHIERLRASGQKILFCGDVNTAHEEIDLARPKENERNTGFLPEERAWLDEVIYHGYTDVFRHLHPHTKDVYTYWDMKTAARERNVGWRIDYFFAAQELLPKIRSIKILENIFGSDHCPVELELQ